MLKSDSIWVVMKETTQDNGFISQEKIGYYTMKSLANKQVRYLNGTVIEKSIEVYRCSEQEANHDFSR